jgi:DNA (cytosine-5)-methyltransferase 1
MIHLGDITKINGYELPIVDCIIGGSPCQDLSVAGKRAGLDGERSSLFLEQLRIIKEMRERDVRDGRTNESVRPRYMLWENVPGAFSSHKGEDFRRVLEETAKVVDKDAVIPMPPKNKWSKSGCIMGDGWSIAWRVCDAQFWGVPQRRNRIALVADFGGESAPQILFVSKSLQRDIDESGEERKGTPPHSQDGFGIQNCNGGVKTYDARGNGNGEVCCTITGDHENRVTDYTALVTAYGFDQGATRDVGALFLEGASKTLVNGSCPGHHNGVVICMDRSAYNQGKNAKFNIGIDENGVAFSCIAKGPGAVCYIDTSHADDVVRMDDIVAPLQARDYKGGKYVMAVDCRNGTEDDCNNSLQSVAAHSLNGNNVVRIGFEVRRLTPLECERLQGYPDYWTDIGEYINSKGKKKKTSDAERYKALGNSIALPSWKWILKKLCACYERDATMASLFDGIGGFPYLWEQINGKGSCLWASEIEDFPIAVTKVRL